MSIALTLLGDVRWRGRPVAGDRPRALLAALAAHECRPVPDEQLIELVWGGEAPPCGLGFTAAARRYHARLPPPARVTGVAFQGEACYL